MILNISPALVIGLASLMLATSAPIDPLNTQAHKPQANALKVWSCVHISIPDSINAGSSDLRTASQGEKLSISIDPSECDQSVIQSTTPWTVFLGNAKDDSAKAVVLAHMVKKKKKQKSTIRNFCCSFQHHLTFRNIAFFLLLPYFHFLVGLWKDRVYLGGPCTFSGTTSKRQLTARILHPGPNNITGWQQPSDGQIGPLHHCRHYYSTTGPSIRESAAVSPNHPSGPYQARPLPLIQTR